MSRLFATLLGLLCAPAALACGQTTHVWVSLEAVQDLPPGELRDLLTDPALRDPFVNGTMFPDGGYAIDDAYGEQAHWEPFQQAWAASLRERYGGDYSSLEARQRVAFLLGMASHGMSDEVFDTLFFELSRQLDPDGHAGSLSFDTATDVTFAADVGGILAPEYWLPADEVVAVFAERIGYSVSQETVATGHQRLHAALAYTEWARQQEERLTTFSSAFPWAASHMADPASPGSPPRQAPVIALYWQEILDRLHEDFQFDDPVLAMDPPDGTWGHPRDHGLVEARVVLTFGRGVEAASLGAIHVEDQDGAAVDLEVRHFYGDHSHTVVLRPQQDWALDARYTVTVEPGLLDFDGDATTSAWTASFSTEEAPPVEAPVGSDPVEEPPTTLCALTGRQPVGLPLALLFPLLRRRR